MPGIKTSGNNNQQQPIRTIVQYKLGRGRSPCTTSKHESTVYSFILKNDKHIMVINAHMVISYNFESL